MHSETVEVEIGEGLKKGCEGETDVALNCQHQGYLPSRNGSPVRASSGGLRCEHLLHRLLKVLISVNKCTSAICLTCSLLQQYYQITNTTHLTNKTKIKNSKNAVYRP